MPRIFKEKAMMNIIISSSSFKSKNLSTKQNLQFVSKKQEVVESLSVRIIVGVIA